MASNQQLKLIDENAKWVREKRDIDVFSLNYNKYKANIELNENQAKRFDAIDDYKTDLSFESLPYEKSLMMKDTVLKEKRSRWHDELKKDVYVEEALSVLEDLKINNIKKRTNSSLTVKN